MDYSAEVNAGIEFLLSHNCNLADIDLNTLNLNDCYKCVLGQFFGEYWSALGVLNMTYGESQGLGFSTNYDDFYGEYDEEEAERAEKEAFAELTEQWKTAISARRAAA
jgi:hypothetical protein